jgi:hypothetical protein
MAYNTEAVKTVKMRGKGGKDDIAMVHPDNVKDFESRGYKAEETEAPKP